jgi:NhaP-type Na+/H+ and K+/H+ antiporter
VDDFMADALGRPPVAGDQVPLGGASLVVRAVQGNRISAVGLVLGA